MTESKYLDSKSLVYPQYISPYPIDDEISLVDLWISLIKFKRVFVVSFLAVLMSGLLVITVFKSDKYDMNTTISIGHVEKGGDLQLLLPPSSVVSQLNLSLLPGLTKQIAQEYDTDLFKTNVGNPKNTNLISIQNKVHGANQESMAQFHKLIADAIITEHLELSRILNSKLEQTLSAEKLVLQKLKDPRELVKLTDFELISLQEEKLSLKKLTDDNYLEGKKNSFQSSIQLYQSKIATLTESNQVLQSQLDSQENPVQRVLILGKIAENDLNISESEEKKLAAESEYADFVIETDLHALKQQTVVDSLESEIKLIESNWKVSIKEKENKIIELKNQLQGNQTRVLSLAEISLKPVGLTKNLAYVLSVALALFAAIFITFIAMFRAKVNEKLVKEA